MGNKYKKPPVVEALCEIHFQSSQWDDTIPGLFYEKIKDAFPERRQLEQIGIEINVSPRQESITKKKAHPRIQFLASDKSRLIQIAPDLLVVNQLRPYPQFEDWAPIMESVVAKYVELTSAAHIAQIGLRYINSIVTPQAPLKDYFFLYPQIPPRRGLNHGAFLMRIEIIPPNQDHRLVTTFGSAIPPTPDSAAYMLDIYDIVGSRASLGSHNLRDAIGKAHENIEAVFESSITDNLRKIFEEKNGGADDDEP